MMKVFDLSGAVKGEMNLPKVFSTEIRNDLIKRAVLAIQSHRRQPYGPGKMAGLRSSAHYHGVRVGPHHMMNKEMARMPRSHGSSGQQEMRARKVPQATSGRRAHPPKPEKKFSLKVNRKEMRIALQSALATTVKENLPIIITDDIQNVSKTKELEKVFIALKLEKELIRGKEKKVRPGKGKMRGRKYKRKKSFLIVINKPGTVIKAAKNVAGVDIVNVKNLNVELLAPGTSPRRVAIFDESSIKTLGERYG